MSPIWVTIYASVNHLVLDSQNVHKAVKGFRIALANRYPLQHHSLDMTRLIRNCTPVIIFLVIICVMHNPVMYRLNFFSIRHGIVCDLRCNVKNHTFGLCAVSLIRKTVAFSVFQQSVLQKMRPQSFRIRAYRGYNIGILSRIAFRIQIFRIPAPHINGLSVRSIIEAVRQTSFRFSAIYVMFIELVPIISK